MIMHGTYICSTLCNNAWRFVGKLGSLCLYTTTFSFKKNMRERKVRVYAYVFEGYTSIALAGGIGVNSLNVQYENQDGSMSLTCSDLEDLLYAWDLAEKKILRIGVPFTRSYKFYGNNKEENEKRNEALRRKLDIKRYERRCWDLLNELEEKKRKQRESEKEEKQE
nr:MAG TPA: hypothetical protein [Caudoviricetes sp.]